MKKTIIISILLVLFSTGCGNEKTLECTYNDDVRKIVVKDNRITKVITNNEKEDVTKEEWNTLKNFYEFDDNVKNDDIIKKIKEINESIGYKCKSK